MSLEKEINNVIGQKLNDGTIEKIVAEQFEKCIIDTTKNLLNSYGDIGEKVKEKIKQAMMPAIENVDFNEYLIKLDTVLTDIVNHTTLQDNKKILENFKELMCEEESKTIKLSEIFEKYCEYVAERVDTSGLEVDYGEDEVLYESICVTATFEDEASLFSSSDWQKGKINFVCATDEDLSFEIDLHRWERFDKTDHWNLRTLGAVDIKSLRYMDDFEVFIHRLNRLGCQILIDGVDLEEYVHPKKTPELTYS